MTVMRDLVSWSVQAGLEQVWRQIAYGYVTTGRKPRFHNLRHRRFLLTTLFAAAARWGFSPAR